MSTRSRENVTELDGVFVNKKDTVKKKKRGVDTVKKKKKKNYS